MRYQVTVQIVFDVKADSKSEACEMALYNIRRLLTHNPEYIDCYIDNVSAYDSED